MKKTKIESDESKINKLIKESNNMNKTPIYTYLNLFSNGEVQILIKEIKRLRKKLKKR